MLTPYNLLKTTRRSILPIIVFIAFAGEIYAADKKSGSGTQNTGKSAAGKALHKSRQGNLGAIQVRALDFDGNALAADVFVDGNYVGRAPALFEVPRRSKEVVVQGEGGGLFRAKLVLRKKKVMQIEARLQSYVHLEGGSFLKQSSSDGDSEISDRPLTMKPFEMKKTEVTVKEYRACVRAAKCSEPGTKSDYTKCNWGWDDRDEHPVNCVDWHRAHAYCSWAGARLPSDAEWEYAARSGGRDIKYPWGDEKASCSHTVMKNEEGEGCGFGHSMAVCSRTEGNTAQGLCDMAGNVEEWVEDSYLKHRGAKRKRKKAPSDGGERLWSSEGPGGLGGFGGLGGISSARVQSAKARYSNDYVVRGGSWEEDGGAHFSTTGRKHKDLTKGSKSLGVRCAAKARYEKEESGTDLGSTDEVVIEFVSNPPGAVVLVDDQPACSGTESRCSRLFSKGAHKVQMLFADDIWHSRSETVDFDSSSRLEWSLEVNFGILNIISEPAGLPVTINGKDAGTTPISELKLATGYHRVMVGGACYDFAGRDVLIEKGGTRTVSFSPGFRMGTLVVRALDPDERVVPADVFVDGERVGSASDELKIPLCSREVVVKTKEGGLFKSNLVLRESKLTKLDARLLSYVHIEGGSFVASVILTGLAPGNSRLERRVHIPSFEMKKTEVTVKEYRACMRAGRCSEPNMTNGDSEDDKYYNWGHADRDNHPVNGVDWRQARAYCGWVGGHLPSEAEWIYAARSGGQHTDSYPWGNEKPECSRAVMGCDAAGTLPVCSKTAGNTTQGLCDMIGNVLEWSEDYYADCNDSGLPIDGTAREPSDEEKAHFGETLSESGLRATHGGSFSDTDPSDHRIRAGELWSPADGFFFHGFRCAVANAH